MKHAPPIGKALLDSARSIAPVGCLQSARGLRFSSFDHNETIWSHSVSLSKRICADASPIVTATNSTAAAKRYFLAAGEFDNLRKVVALELGVCRFDIHDPMIFLEKHAEPKRVSTLLRRAVLV